MSNVKNFKKTLKDYLILSKTSLIFEKNSK